MSFGLRFENKESSRIRAFATMFAIAALLSANVACEESTSQSTATLPSTTPTPTPGASPTPTPTIPPVGGKMAIKALFPSVATTYLHKGTAAGADWSVACDADPDDSIFSNRDVTCVVDVNELDLYFNEFRFQWEVPPRACHYIQYRPYWFYSYEPGIGPSTVDIEITDGVITNTTPATFPNDPTSELTFRNGVEACKYDYTHLLDGENCCYGSYTLTTTTIDTGDPADPNDDETTVVAEQKEWGGAFGNCARGPGKTAWQSFTRAQGIPVPALYSAWSGTTGEHLIPSAISLSYRTNLHASNMVVSNASIWTRQAIKPPDLSGVGYAGAWGQPYYQWQCLDQAMEVKAQFKVFVREWNQTSEFLKGVAGNSSADPDTSGTEQPPWPTPGPPGEERENPNTNYNDFWDWDDMISTTTNFIRDLL